MSSYIYIDINITTLRENNTTYRKINFIYLFFYDIVMQFIN